MEEDGRENKFAYSTKGRLRLEGDSRCWNLLAFLLIFAINFSFSLIRTESRLIDHWQWKIGTKWGFEFKDFWG